MTRYVTILLYPKWLAPELQEYMPDVRFKLFEEVTMENAVFLDVAPCDSCKNKRFGGKYRPHYQREKNLLLLVIGNVPSSLIPSTLMMNAIRSSHTSVPTRATRCHIPDDGIPECKSDTNNHGAGRRGLVFSRHIPVLHFTWSNCRCVGDPCFCQQPTLVGA
jgi:hypothetical protein